MNAPRSSEEIVSEIIATVRQIHKAPSGNIRVALAEAALGALEELEADAPLIRAGMSVSIHLDELRTLLQYAEYKG